MDLFLAFSQSEVSSAHDLIDSVEVARAESITVPPHVRGKRTVQTSADSPQSMPNLAIAINFSRAPEKTQVTGVNR